MSVFSRWLCCLLCFLKQAAADMTAPVPTMKTQSRPAITTTRMSSVWLRGVLDGICGCLGDAGVWLFVFTH